MRFGFFTDSYLPATHGVEVSIETCRTNLAKAGHKVFVYAPAVPGYTDTNRRVCRLKSVRVIDNPEMRLAFPVVEDGHGARRLPQKGQRVNYVTGIPCYLSLRKDKSSFGAGRRLKLLRDRFNKIVRIDYALSIASAHRG